MDTFNVIVGWASIAGLLLTIISFGITVYVARKVGRIGESIARRGTLPQYLGKLEAAITNMTGAHRTKNAPRMRQILTEYRSTLDNLRVHLDKLQQQHWVKTVAVIDRLLTYPNEFSWDDYGLALAGLRGLHSTIQDQMEETNWKVRDG